MDCIPWSCYSYHLYNIDIHYFLGIMKLKSFCFHWTNACTAHVMSVTVLHALQALIECGLCVCVCVCVHLVTQSCLTLCDPMDYSLPGSSVHRILQARILEGFQSFLQGIVLIQGSNSGRLHCRQSQECVWNTTIENSGFMSLDMKNRGRISAHPYIIQFSNYSPKRHLQQDHWKRL